MDLDVGDHERHVRLLLEYLREAYGIKHPLALAMSAGTVAEWSRLHWHYRAPVGDQLGILLEVNDKEEPEYVPAALETPTS